MPYCTPELGHLRAALRTAQHGHKGDDEDLDEIVPHVLGTDRERSRTRR
jgi:hypothetical protein